MSRNLVVKDNALINASYNLELIEQRLILLAIAQSRQKGQELNEKTKIEISVADYIDVYSQRGRSVYENIKNACRTLFERQFSYLEKAKKGEWVVTSRWVSEIAYLDDLAKVRMSFSPAVVPLISLLEKQFTSYDLEQVSGLSSKYAIRLYELVISWRSQGKTNQISVEKIRERLGVPDDEYVLIADFKKRVLDSAVKQINEKSDIVLSYEQKKQGRKIIGFTFAIKQKNKTKKAQKETERDGNTLDMLAPIKMTDNQRAMFASKLSQLSELGTYAPEGASYEEYAKKIEKDLLDQNKAEFYRPYLVKVGFKL